MRNLNTFSAFIIKDAVKCMKSGMLTINFRFIFFNSARLTGYDFIETEWSESVGVSGVNLFGMF